MKGHYTLTLTAADGRPLREPYGPWTLAETRQNVPIALRVDNKTLEFAIAVTTKNPGVPYTLSGVMRAKVPHMPEYDGLEIAWTADLIYHTEGKGGLIVIP